MYLFIVGDSVVFDQQLIASTPDAHSGSRAVELRNAYNYTSNYGIAGAISLDADSVFMAWSAFELVPITAPPADLSFWYRFTSVNGDTAQALLQVFDSLGTELGQAQVLLTVPASTYTRVQQAVTYHTPGQPAFFSLRFSTFYTAGGHGVRQPGLGTRLTIDEVALGAPLGVAGQPAVAAPALYPNPATDELRVGSTTSPPTLLELFDSRGLLVRRESGPQRVSLAGLTPGLYVARLHTRAGVQTQRVVKQ